ncbi:MAG TPA: DUF5916 domain-containing protein [Flavisolibacter sp.]|nr:DUF5916 domain-containing protein [Flavisolibacter sp.]
MRLTLLSVPLFLGFFAIGQPKTLTAVKTVQPLRIDGVLDDAAWEQAPLATQFVQNFPTYGVPASARSEVKILYDNSAVYIGAHLYDNPSLIRKQITARDGEQQQDADYFSVFFDTYNDHQNGFQFLVTPANVQTDAKLTPTANPGFGEFGDKTWDAVWQSETAIVSDGWIVEIKIPYLSLRFAKKDVQSWGLQFLRFTRRNNERSYWNGVDPNVNGFVNQFGIYASLNDIKPPLRLSFSPYVSGGVRFNPEGNRISTEWLRNGGMDVKYGINESFTLDATLIPDFGQVISDNVVNNLTPYEVRFQENRPFFTEGTELFNKAGLFYSRRVGAPPTGYSIIEAEAENDPNIEIVKNPSSTQLYNAIKFSGRTKKKLGIGIFNAIAAPMHAVVRDKTTGVRNEYETEPLTNYNIVVLDQALKGRSYVTFTNTSVLRSNNGSDANVTGLDVSLYDKSNVFNIKAKGRYSRIFSNNSCDGFNTSLRLGKVSGKVQYYIQGEVLSKRYNPRDLGYLQTPNQSIYTGVISYNQFKPTKNFLSYKYSLTTAYQRLYEPNRFNSLQIVADGFWYLKNFWDIRLAAAYLPDQHDYFLFGSSSTRFARRPAFGYLSLSGSSDSRKRLFFSYEYLLAHFFSAPNKKYHDIEMGLRYRFSNKFTMELSNSHEAETDYIVYAGKEPNGEPIIGFVDFREVESVLSGIYNFTPRINLTLRARHYWSRVPYKGFAHVDGEGNAVTRPYMAGYDENQNIFNLDAFFTWDFRLGSRVILGWKNWLGDEYGVDGMTHKTYLGNFGRTFSYSHGNEITLRFIYFLDYNQFRKGH